TGLPQPVASSHHDHAGVRRVDGQAEELFMRAIHRQSRPRVTAVIAHEKLTGRPAVNPRRVGGTALYSMDARRWENPGRTGDPSGLGLAFRLGLLGPGGGDDGDRAGKEKEANPKQRPDTRREEDHSLSSFRKCETTVHRRDDPTFLGEPQGRGRRAPVSGDPSALLVDPLLRQLDRILVGLLKRRARFGPRRYGLLRSAWPAKQDHRCPGPPSTRIQRLRVWSNQVILVGNGLHSFLRVPGGRRPFPSRGRSLS